MILHQMLARVRKLRWLPDNFEDTFRYVNSALGATMWLCDDWVR